MKKALSLDPSFEPAQTGLLCAQQDRENKLKRGWWRCTTYCYWGLYRYIKILHILCVLLCITGHSVKGLFIEYFKSTCVILTKSTDNTYKMSLYLRCWKPFMTTASHSCYLNCCHHRFKLFCCPVSFCWNFTSKIYFPFNSLLSMINKSISHIYIWVCFLFSLYLDLFTMAIIRFCIYKSKKYKNTKRYVFIF